MKLKYFRGDLTDISAIKEALVTSDCVLADTRSSLPRNEILFTVQSNICRIEYLEIVDSFSKQIEWWSPQYCMILIMREFTGSQKVVLLNGHSPSCLHYKNDTPVADNLRPTTLHLISRQMHDEAE